MELRLVAAGMKGINKEKPFVWTSLEVDGVVKRCAERGIRLGVATANRIIRCCTE
jgi:hypothetical protein